MFYNYYKKIKKKKIEEEEVEEYEKEEEGLKKEAILWYLYLFHFLENKKYYM